MEPGPPAGAGGHAQGLSHSGLCSWVRRAGTAPPPRVPLGLTPPTPECEGLREHLPRGEAAAMGSAEPPDSTLASQPHIC